MPLILVQLQNLGFLAEGESPLNQVQTKLYFWTFADIVLSLLLKTEKETKLIF